MTQDDLEFRRHKTRNCVSDPRVPDERIEEWMLQVGRPDLVDEMPWFSRPANVLQVVGRVQLLEAAVVSFAECSNFLVAEDRVGQP